VHGLGWSRLSGGPFYEARQAGIGALVERMQRWSREDPVFDVPPLLRAALESGDDIDAALRRGKAGAVRTG
ncbi:hypothetical protein NHG85_08050, partial [Limimaricola sp. ASW11-118]|nr:hypothetical protein [Limimaricola litoreus]